MNLPKPLLTVATTLLVLLPLLLATPAKAFGYTDPGTGAFVYQAMYAVFLGGSFYLRKFLDRLGRRRKKAGGVASSSSPL
jgi:hypothetical protein